MAGPLLSWAARVSLSHARIQSCLLLHANLLNIHAWARAAAWLLHGHGGLTNVLLLLHVELLQIQLGTAHTVAKVHGLLLYWQTMQLLRRQPSECQLLQLLIVLLVLL